MTIRDFALKAARKFIYPALPRSVRLPFNYWLCSVAGSVEPELRHMEALCKARGVAIDVGANVGLYSYRMAQIFSKVYAFEINEGLASHLIEYGSKRVEIIISGLSSEERDATLYIPVSKGVVLNGWASLMPGNCPDTQEHVTKPVKVRPLDSFSLRDISFIKIDVEGHEVEVLRGAVETISANRPVILVEVKESNIGKVASFFRGIDYEEVSLKSLCGVEGADENRIFVPRKNSGKTRQGTQ
jgi:FkbM family methyltransferase